MPLSRSNVHRLSPVFAVDGLLACLWEKSRPHVRFLTLFVCFMVPGALVWAAEEFRVVATIKPIHSILAGLMEGIQPPELLLSGNSTPFGHVLTSDRVESLNTASLVVWVGPELEPFLTPHIAELEPEISVLTLLDNPSLKILPSRWDESARDPYFWLDSRNGIILIDELTRALVAADPARSHLYKRNRTRSHQRMAKLDRKLEYGYRGLKSGQGLAYYDTQQYFEQAYALKIGEALAESPLSTVDAADLVDSRVKLASGDYACLVTEAPFKTAHLGLLTDGLDINTGSLDSLGIGFEAGADLYFNMMEHNTETIKNCLRRAGTDVKAAPNPRQDPAAEVIGGRFLLMDHNGGLFTDKDMLGKYQLILFGYISCPDVCPMSLLAGAQALDMIGEKKNRIQSYFISLDPERDTPAVIANYVRYFDDEMIGLTGTQTMIARVARQYNVDYEKVYAEGGDANSYAMDHTASFFLMAPNGRFITKIAYGVTSEQLAAKLDENIP